MKTILEQLFTTEALVVSDGIPFLYTSGEVGPFYINTHYLYGNKKMAEDLLLYIDKFKNTPEFEETLTKKLMKQYNENEIYHSVIDQLVILAKEKVEFNKVDMISGGERRDWIFSIPVANLLELPHVFLYKNHHISNHLLDNKNLLHICDLINSASSYIRDWKPIINHNNGYMDNTLTVVNRNQGGKKILNDVDIKLYSLISFTIDSFKSAAQCGRINKEQLKMIEKYLLNTNDFLIEFVDNNQSYIKQLQEQGDKQQKRVRLLLQKYYEFK